MDYILNLLKSVPWTKVATIGIIMIACLITVKLVLILFDKCIKKTKLDAMIYKILRITIKVFLLCIALIIILSSLGISVSSLVAALSVVGVAISLAIQGFLSNVFGGIQIISNKPFRIGDYVDAGGESGTVREVGLFYTKLDTPDNKLIQVPNSTIANSNITNYSSAANRRVDITVGVSYDYDIEKVKSVLSQLLEKHPFILKENGLAPIVHVNAYLDNNIEYVLRAWCKSDDYWTVYFDVMDTIKPTLDQEGITISYPHVNLHVIEK